jgi:uncharacterized protein YceK
MAKSTTSTAMALVVAITLSGCGTLQNLNNVEHPSALDHLDRAAYGGVQRDIEVTRQVFRGQALPPDYNSVQQALTCCFAGVYLVVDLPLSAIGDTLTLPVTMSQNSSQNGQTAGPSIPEVAKSPPPKNIESKEGNSYQTAKVN